MLLRPTRLFACGIICLLIFSGCCAAAEFTADWLMVSGDSLLVGKVYIKGDKMRVDLKFNGHHYMTYLAHSRKNVTYFLDPDHKVYWIEPERAFDGLDYKRVRRPADQKSLGKETINGYCCEKVLFVHHDKSYGTEVRYYPEKLKVPIRIEHRTEEERMMIEYRNIKEQKLSDSLFIIPAQYKKVTQDQFKSILEEAKNEHDDG